MAFVFVSFTIFKFVDNQFARTHQRAQTETRLGHTENAVRLYEGLLNKWEDKCGDDIYREYIVAAKQFYPEKELEHVLSRLAPDSGNDGIPQAHAEIAIRLSPSIKSGLSGSQLTRLQLHLDNSPDVDLPELHRVRGQFQSVVGDKKKAIEHFRKAAKYDPTYWLTIAKIYQAQRKTNLWKETLQEAHEAISSELDDHRDSQRLRLSCAEVLFHLDRLDESENVLIAGLTETVTKENERAIKNVLSKLLLVRLQRSDNSGTAMRYECLKKSLRYNSDNLRAHFAIQQLIQGLPLGEQKKKLMTDIISLAENDKSGNFAFTLAAIFKSESDFEKALAWSEKAIQLDPDNHSKQSQLSHLELFIPEGDLTRAIALARSAVTKKPSRPAYRLNLGQILMRMDRYEDAVVELKIGLTCADEKMNVSLKRSIHVALIECLSEIGHHDLAQSHIRRLDVSGICTELLSHDV